MSIENCRHFGNNIVKKNAAGRPDVVCLSLSACCSVASRGGMGRVASCVAPFWAISFYSHKIFNNLLPRLLLYNKTLCSGFLLSRVETGRSKLKERQKWPYNRQIMVVNGALHDGWGITSLLFAQMESPSIHPGDVFVLLLVLHLFYLSYLQSTRFFRIWELY